MKNESTSTKDQDGFTILISLASLVIAPLFVSIAFSILTKFF